MSASSQGQQDARGFWEPHTAGFNFCELDYQVTNYVAEWTNSLTSLFICYAGFLVWEQASQFLPSSSTSSSSSSRPKRADISALRFRLYLLASLLGVIGVGSGLFHGTLAREAQILDELPMFWATVAFHYALDHDEDAPSGAAGGRKLGRKSLLALALAIALTVIYFHLPFVWFLGLYACLIARLVFLLWRRVCVVKLAGTTESRLERLQRARRDVALLAVGAYVGG